MTANKTLLASFKPTILHPHLALLPIGLTFLPNSMPLSHFILEPLLLSLSLLTKMLTTL